MRNAPSAPVELFRRHDAVVAESLVADGSDVLWCDITAGTIHRSPIGGAIDGSDDEVLQLPGPVCSFHPAESGFVVSLTDSVVLVDRSGSVLRELAHIDHAGAHMRMNEGKVDPAGRWVTGSMELDDGAPIGAFYAVTPTGDCLPIAEGIGTANGLEWSPDGTRVYFTDTAAGTIFTARYGPDGRIDAVEVFHSGAPHDGLVIDSEGNFWGGIFGEGRVVHLDADGRELFSVAVPVPNVTSVAFNGATLYIATATEKLSPQQLAAYPLSGSVFSLDTGVTARLPYTFGG